MTGIIINYEEKVNKKGW